VTAIRQLATVVLAAAAGAVMLAMLARPGGYSGHRHHLVPLLACVLVVVLRRWPLPVTWRSAGAAAC
jgi:hypothetical protein